jgi:hypothetical protein
MDYFPRYNYALPLPLSLYNGFKGSLVQSWIPFAFNFCSDVPTVCWYGERRHDRGISIRGLIRDDYAQAAQTKHRRAAQMWSQTKQGQITTPGTAEYQRPCFTQRVHDSREPLPAVLHQDIASLITAAVTTEPTAGTGGAPQAAAPVDVTPGTAVGGGPPPATVTAIFMPMVQWPGMLQMK